MKSVVTRVRLRVEFTGKLMEFEKKLFNNKLNFKLSSSIAKEVSIDRWDFLNYDVVDLEDKNFTVDFHALLSFSSHINNLGLVLSSMQFKVETNDDNLKMIKSKITID